MLSPDQLKARLGKLTASRVAVLMRGDAEGIMNLWRELTGDPTYIPEDLSHVWPVRLGEATETLNLNWYAMKGNRVSRRGDVAQHPSIEWAAATLDGWDDDLHCVIECKHVGGREPLEIVIERYQPQMQWSMECTGAKQCALSVIMGASPPIVEYIEYEPAYAAEMVRRGKQFMDHVAARTPPVILDPVPAPIVADRTVDMSGNETWQRHATQWLQVRGAADTARECEKVLKSIVPENAKKAFGFGVRITRDRVNRLSLREDRQ
jgi:predicted phage-related endonuclease